VVKEEVDIMNKTSIEKNIAWIKYVRLKISGIHLVITMEEARELHRTLDEICHDVDNSVLAKKGL